jgi:gluconolactonase
VTEWQWEKIAKHAGLTEGPAWDGSGLLYNECAAHTTFRWDPATGKSSAWRSKTGAANGMVFDRNGNLYACEGDAHRVTKVDAKNPGADPEVIAGNFGGQTLNWPNDIAVTGSGRVYFSDPNYNRSVPNNLPHESVYLAEHSFGGAWNLTRVTYDTRKPNGVLLSQDERTLFVADSPSDPTINSLLLAYPVRDNGTLGDASVLFNFGQGRGIDGMTLTTDGKIVATAGSSRGGPGSMIYVFEQSGLVRSTHPTPADMPTNCTFGGSGLNELFVTFGTGYLYRVPNSGMQGHLAYPQRRY